MPGKSGRITYFIDARDDIVSVEGNWDDFAIGNDAPELAGAKVVRTKLWEHVTGGAVRHIYRQLLVSVRAGKTIEFEFRCDSPDLFRLNLMTISPAQDDHVKFDVVPIRVEKHTRKTESPDPKSESVMWLTACSWCLQIETAKGTWHEIAEAIPITRLFQSDELLQITHGICPTCLATKFGRPGSGPSLEANAWK